MIGVRSGVAGLPVSRMVQTDPVPQSQSTPPGSTSPRSVDRLGIAASVIAGLFVLALSWFKLASVDIGYHVAYGGEFLDHGTIVDRDPFLLPSVAKHFINANWGSQVIMAVAFRVAGAGGLIALRVLLIATIFGLMGWIVRRATGRWQPVAWTWLVAGLAAYERFTMRPELLSYAVLLAMLAVLHRRTLTRRGVIALVLLQLLWVNLHSYFLIGLMLTGAYAAVGVVGLLPGRSDDGETTNRRSQVRLLVAALVFQIAVCFINPWFHEGAMFPFGALRNLKERGVLASEPGQTAADSPWSAISEFHSPWSHVGLRAGSRTLFGYVVLLALAAIATVVAILRRRWAELLFLAILFAMSLQMRRNIAQFALAGAPIAICLIAAARNGIGPSAVRKLGSMGASVTVMVFAIVWCIGIVEGRFYFSERRLNREFGAGWSDRSFINGAAAWLASQADTSGVFNPGDGLFVNYNASSNVLPWLGHRFRMLVDTNTFAYDEDVLGLAQRLGQGTPQYTEDLDTLGLGVVLIQCGADADGLARQLAADFTEWQLVYFDQRAVIFVRRTSRHVPLIAVNRLNSSKLDPNTWIAETRGSARSRALQLGMAAQVPLVLNWSDRAIPILQQAVQLAPDYDEAWVNLGQCFGIRANRARVEGRTAEQAATDLQEAIRCFETALRVYPKSAEAAINLHKARQSLESLFGGARNPRT